MSSRPPSRSWRVESTRVLVDRPWLRVHQQAVVLPSGARIDEFHLIDGPDWAAALALTEEGKIVVVEQYRHGAVASSVELPAGVIEPGEDPLHAAQRELLEETGYEASAWELLLAVHPEPARHTNRAFFYFARGARRVAAQTLDHVEDIAVREVDGAELVATALEGRLLHGVHVGALLAAHARGWLAPLPSTAGVT